MEFTFLKKCSELLCLLGNCKNNSIKNKPANKGEKAELCEDMKYTGLNSPVKLFPPPVPFEGCNDVL